MCMLRNTLPGRWRVEPVSFSAMKVRMRSETYESMLCYAMLCYAMLCHAMRMQVRMRSETDTKAPRHSGTETTE